ncbi:MAG: hydroxymethylglutaryl-CoA reductase, degradative [Candidatus Methanoperedens sp.]|nr:hydroxymethylglutaryl-CoA reductase, degradative [Candidatus Methanoperedens sp.]
MTKTSKIPGFYKLSPDERLKAVSEFSNLAEEEASNIRTTGALDIDAADMMAENVIGVMEVPMGVAVNFLINGKDYLIPMATEEPSVIAAASNSAKMARDSGGFITSNTGPVMIGQVQAVGISDPYGARITILENRDEIIKQANEVDPVLVRFGGGAKDIEVRVVESPGGPMVVTHLIVDCRDAMGANAVNTMAEAVAPYIEKITGGRVYLRIISNFADRRIVRAKAVFNKDAIGGSSVVEGIIAAYNFAASDPYRASTHNKGIMNGVTAAVLATGNDTRAIEAGAHSYASRSGTYSPLTRYEKNRDGDLVATIEMPMAVGLVGGATKTNPIARAAVKILGVKTATEMGEVFASLGLAQNFAAMRALATEGIQRGHMGLHSRNVAIQAGAAGDLVDKIASIMVEEKKVRADRAKELLEELQKTEKTTKP